MRAAGREDAVTKMYATEEAIRTYLRAGRHNAETLAKMQEYRESQSELLGPINRVQEATQWHA
jgi:hypothetical protein